MCVCVCVCVCVCSTAHSRQIDSDTRQAVGRQTVAGSLPARSPSNPSRFRCAQGVVVSLCLLCSTHGTARHGCAAAGGDVSAAPGPSARDAGRRLDTGCTCVWQSLRSPPGTVTSPPHSAPLASVTRIASLPLGRLRSLLSTRDTP